MHTLAPLRTTLTIYRPWNLGDRDHRMLHMNDACCNHNHRRNAYLGTSASPGLVWEPLDIPVAGSYRSITMVLSFLLDT